MKLYLLALCFGFSGYAANAQSATGFAGVDCRSSSSAPISVASVTSGWLSTGFHQCDLTPDSIKVTFYKLGLCTSAPTYADTSSCVFLLDNPSGIEVDLSKTSPSTLIEQVSFPVGSYPYATMMISNDMAVKQTIEFDVAMETRNGTSGTTCWTNGNARAMQATGNYTADSMFDCGNGNPSPTYSEVSFKGFWNDNYVPGTTPTSAQPNYLNNLTGLRAPGADSEFDVYLLSVPGTLATVTDTAILDASSNVMGYMDSGNAQYMWGVQRFDAPKVISAATSNMDLAFSITRGTMLGFGAYCPGNVGSITHACLETQQITSFAFKVDLR